LLASQILIRNLPKSSFIFASPANRTLVSVTATMMLDLLAPQ